MTRSVTQTSTTKMIMNLIIILTIIISTAESLLVSSSLGSNMVLQRAPKRANIWGWSFSAGSNITLVFADNVYTTTTSLVDGSWNIFLPPTPAGGPYTIDVNSTAFEKVTLTNVLFGDVYICGGQSNMAMTVDFCYNNTEESAAAAAYSSKIRVFTAGQSIASPTPLREFYGILSGWSEATPAVVGAYQWSGFSAVCWFFGKSLYDKMGIPLGLVSDNLGGSPIEAWVTSDSLQQCSGSQATATSGYYAPTQLWNAMIIPVINMTIKAAIWYQGESNSGAFNYYACEFPAMIREWRQKWGGDTDKDFPFMYVQLAPWLYGNVQYIREAQLYANYLPKVGFVTAGDLGDPLSPLDSIHPRAKKPIGTRLASLAQALVYNQNVPYTGPFALSWAKINDNTVEVTFDDSSVGSGLTNITVTCHPNVPIDQCTEYEIGIPSGWVKATGTIVGRKVRVSSDLVGSSNITGVRYGFSSYPLMTLQNNDGFPATPFNFPSSITPSYTGTPPVYTQPFPTLTTTSTSNPPSTSTSASEQVGNSASTTSAAAWAVPLVLILLIGGAIGGYFLYQKLENKPSEDI